MVSIVRLPIAWLCIVRPTAVAPLPHQLESVRGATSGSSEHTSATTPLGGVQLGSGGQRTGEGLGHGKEHLQRRYEGRGGARGRG